MGPTLRVFVPSRRDSSFLQWGHDNGVVKSLAAGCSPLPSDLPPLPSLGGRRSLFAGAPSNSGHQTTLKPTSKRSKGAHYINVPAHLGTSNNLESWSIPHQEVEGINSPSDLMILASRDQAGSVAPDKQVPCFPREHGQEGTKDAGDHGKSPPSTTCFSRNIDA
jgi:hypothetical protein